MLQLQPQHLGKTIEPDHYAAATLYRAFVNSALESRKRLNDLAAKLRLTFRGQSDNCSEYAKALLTNAKLIPHNTPNMLRYHHLRLIYNAAPTGRRTRFWNREGEVVCHLCGLHEDSVEHLYFLCRVVLGKE